MANSFMEVVVFDLRHGPKWKESFTMKEVFPELTDEFQRSTPSVFI